MLLHYFLPKTLRKLFLFSTLIDKSPLTSNISQLLKRKEKSGLPYPYNRTFWFLVNIYIYLPKTKKFGCVGGETWLLFSFQKLRNRQKSGETCQVTWEIRRVLRVDRRTAKKSCVLLRIVNLFIRASNRFSTYQINVALFSTGLTVDS